MSLLDWLKKKFDAPTFTRLDENSSIRRIDRDSYEYREEDHAMILKVELQSGNPNVVFYTSTVERWQPPYDNQPISEQHKQEIIRKVCKFLIEGGVTHRFA